VILSPRGGNARPCFLTGAAEAGFAWLLPGQFARPLMRQTV
jgi:hypothetical protein